MTFTDSSGQMVFERLQYQRKTGRFTDCEVHVSERLFAAHRNVLAAHSPYFDAIFKFTKITKEHLTINSREPEAFERVLNYMYSGKIIIDRHTIREILRFSNNFMIMRLKNYCFEYLDRYMDASNSLSIRNLAYQYNFPALVKSSISYFDANLNRCLLEDLDILNYSFTQLTRLMEQEKYKDCISADTYLKLIVRWVGKTDDPRSLTFERQPMFRILLEKCEFREVSAETLEFLLDYSPLLQKNPPSRYLTLHVMEQNEMLMDKYTAQLASLRQKIGELPPLNPSGQFEDEYYETDDSGGEQEEDHIAEGHPTLSQVLNQPLKMKLVLNKKSDKYRLKRPRPSTNTKDSTTQAAPENESIPWTDEDGIDGVFATASLEQAHTYGPEDLLDPDDCDDDQDDVADENGECVCIYCGFRTSDEDMLEKHKARYHNRNTYYLCHLCEFETNWSKQFYSHCNEHWTERPYRCEECSFVSNRLQDFLTHRLEHTDERFFKCGECAWKGRTRSQLFAHERMHSVLDNRPLHCEECGRGFYTHSALDHHIDTHDDVRKLICQDCGFATKTNEHLIIHRRQHSADNFNCHIAGCEYSATKKSQLAAHLRTHMAVRAHLCKQCGRGFIEKSHLVRHERIHLEEKPFKCDQCEYASSRRDKLKEHIIKHHNTEAGLQHKTQRRRNKRQRMLAAATNLAPHGGGNNNPEALFRPITIDEQMESVTTWQRQNFDSYSSPRHNDFGPSTSTFNNHSPPRAFSSVGPAHQSHHQQQGEQSPGAMSMLNMPLRENHHLVESTSNAAPPSLQTSIAAPVPQIPVQVQAPVPSRPIQRGPLDGIEELDVVGGLDIQPMMNDFMIRNAHNNSVVPPFNMPSTSDAPPLQQQLRPLSLPTYGQMDFVQAMSQAHLQQQLQQQLQALQQPNLQLGQNLQSLAGSLPTIAQGAPPNLGLTAQNPANQQDPSVQRWNWQ
ncbi:unnamed protein product [Caenorhabditis sp. 36 PRJEB53466]|nr:unnamed protein product [Caenorhabditis sp. 36 PRJEB53466]